MDPVTPCMELMTEQSNRRDQTDKCHHLKCNSKNSKANWGGFIWALDLEGEKDLELLSIATMIKFPRKDQNFLEFLTPFTWACVAQLV